MSVLSFLYCVCLCARPRLLEDLGGGEGLELQDDVVISSSSMRPETSTGAATCRLPAGLDVEERSLPGDEVSLNVVSVWRLVAASDSVVMTSVLVRVGSQQASVGYG